MKTKMIAMVAAVAFVTLYVALQMNQVRELLGLPPKPVTA